MSLTLIETSELKMSSREIAELCSKEHFHVKRDIKKMLEELGLDASNYGCIYFDQYNREQNAFELPKNLTINLVAGYRSDLRLKIIDRWLELEQSPQAQIQVVIKQAQILAEVEKKQREQDNRLSLVENKVKLLDSETGYRTITAHCKFIGKSLPRNEAQALGMKATKICQERNLKTGRVSDERFGTVKSYPIEVLEELFPQ